MNASIKSPLWGSLKIDLYSIDKMLMIFYLTLFINSDSTTLCIHVLNDILHMNLTSYCYEQNVCVDFEIDKS